MIRIDKGVSLAAGSTTARYPFAVMTVGDSFGMPITDSDRGTVVPRLRAAAAQYARRSGRRYSVRAGADEVRVWRTE